MSSPNVVDSSRDLYMSMSSHLICQCQSGQGMIKDQEMSYLQYTCQLSLTMSKSMMRTPSFSDPANSSPRIALFV